MGIFGALSFILVVMPTVDIYFWIVVQGCRKEMNNNDVAPAQGMMMYPGAGAPVAVIPMQAY